MISNELCSLKNGIIHPFIPKNNQGIMFCQKPKCKQGIFPAQTLEYLEDNYSHSP